MSRITPYLYLGGAREAQDWNFLRSKKVSLIVNAAKEIPNYFENHFAYIKLDLDDVPTQDLTGILEPVSNEIIKAMKSGLVVFVHCAAGVSRSASIVIYTLMKLHHWDFPKTLKFVKEFRSIVNPNSGFVEQLMHSSSLGHSQNQGFSQSHEQKFESQHETELMQEDEPPNKRESSAKKSEPLEHSSEWSKLTFDCKDCELPPFSRSKHGIYARIFAGGDK